MVSGSGGGTGVTTYAENMGVMAITRIYSTALFIAAAIIAILLGFSPKFGALIQTIPGPVLGGLSIVVFGLIAATAGRIWVENRVDFSKPAISSRWRSRSCSAPGISNSTSRASRSTASAPRRSAASSSITCSAGRNKK